MSNLLNEAINNVMESNQAFCHFISANEVGATGGHQCGFLIPKEVWPMFFDKPGLKGSNKDRYVRINWPQGMATDSRIVYYGKSTRNEYRLTRFGKEFPYLREECAGDLLILTHIEEDEYRGFVLSHDEDIDAFLAYFDLSPNNLGKLIEKKSISPKKELPAEIASIISAHTSFPTTSEMSRLARQIFNKSHRFSAATIKVVPDKALLGWINTEFTLFRAFEDKDFSERALKEISDCQTLINYANSLTNRRKSRAGKSLEHHLASIFALEGLKFEEQVVTEGNKKPDFIFPDGESYHNILFSSEGLTFLGAKTTCKDRWRQVLNEADRIPHKFLFTLQQGISANQLKEMKAENLSLVVPKSHIKTFDQRYRENIYSLIQFIHEVREKQNKYFKI